MKLDKFSRRQVENVSRNFNNAKRIVPSFLRAQQGGGMRTKMKKMMIGSALTLSIVATLPVPSRIQGIKVYQLRPAGAGYGGSQQQK